MILVVGANGMLGQDLMALLGDSARGVDVGEMDITSLESVQRIVNTIRPSTVINCAAYTDVDGCETNRELAMRVNGDGVANLAAATSAIKAKLVLISTDYVFDGSKGSPYLENDKTGPLSVYGETKLQGEINAAVNPDHLIIRTQWLYGVNGKNFVETMLCLAEEKDELSVVDDQIGSPTWTVDLSKVIIALLNKECRGIYHAANSGFCSWNQFARAIFEEAGKTVAVRAMTTAELNRPARRPLYSTLDCSRLVRDSGFTPQNWREALKSYLALRK
jgi:dTDP-4-dehydrorhamnose reductase